MHPTDHQSPSGAFIVLAVPCTIVLLCKRFVSGYIVEYKGFTATYQQNEYVFTVTNTATLIQTGQLIWPIPVLALIGVLLIAAGWILLQKPRAEDA